jgi:hypothetical protein
MKTDAGDWQKPAAGEQGTGTLKWLAAALETDLSGLLGTLRGLYLR